MSRAPPSPQAPGSPASLPCTTLPPMTILCRVVAQELGMVKAAEVGLALLGPSSQHLGPKAFSNASWLPGTPH